MGLLTFSVTSFVNIFIKLYLNVTLSRPLPARCLGPALSVCIGTIFQGPLRTVDGWMHPHTCPVLVQVGLLRPHDCPHCSCGGEGAEPSLTPCTRPSLLMMPFQLLPSPGDRALPWARAGFLGVATPPLHCPPTHGRCLHLSALHHGCCPAPSCSNKTQ